MERDYAGRIVAVNLRGAWVNDVEMIELADCPISSAWTFRTRGSATKAC